jgi:hypothetical protein
MRSLVLRTLLTACCIVLALPAGWCCYVSPRRLDEGKELPTTTHAGCRDLCGCQDREQPPPPPSEPSFPWECCCYELNGLLPPAPERADCDLSLPVLLPVAATGTCWEMSRPALDLSLPVPSPPLHVLHCVWLC